MPQGTELKDYGRLRRDGELKIHSHEANAAGVGKNAKSRYLFVFDKVLLVCKSMRGDHYRFVIYEYADSQLMGATKFRRTKIHRSKGQVRLA